jgi:predicted CXXCH cytochrome family protein
MVRRWTVFLAGAILWLVLVAVPAFADGGPHVAGLNSGTSVLTADGCAGCHRAHTAQGPMLLKDASEEDLCLSCHGSASAGATTSVTDGVQYAPGTNGNTNVVLGALRGGGFVNARIDAGNAFRETYALPAEASHPTVFGFDKKVGVGAAEPVTSGHMHVGTSGVTLQGTAWGNGAYSSTANAGPPVSLGCTSCHNPHGNGQYRILNPIPDPATGTVVSVSPYATTPINVTDAANPTNTTRNYTVIQWDAAAGARYLLASEIVADVVDPAAGDYWHQIVPYNARVSDSTVANHDGPNGLPATFNGQINAWCATCHSRYTQSTNFSQGARDGSGTPVGSNGIPIPGSVEVPGNLRTAVCVLDLGGNCNYPNTLQPMNQGTGDGVFNYRHTTSRNRACTTCHVSHGSNAAMIGTSSSLFPYPNGTISASSRLLKIDNRGTCQVCHDPTMTTVVGDVTNGPAPALP